ncbi:MULTISPECIES: adenylate/guanylate cyclase domain-containing protein [Microbacterium]|uniref:adenylate/guanylate cyclase domain-containing protein n=1 Tax=Microbacterium TaxID=33882 RepID=UPI000DD102BB|nr:adenylate/guanylate cyclase domain-containing protein [Microbacterium sp. PM5]AXA97209.1 adenylate/guanylate cyclase domain-containing protein [Microbacterium sp. PM5]MDC7803470.1 adenylate/guanylate cyclase domain-containing protein [Sphingomonas sp. BLCC-B65]
MSGANEGTAGSVQTRPRWRLSIQSRLLVMLLAVGIVSAGVVGTIGYVSGQESLRDAIVDKLTAARELRTGEVSALVGEIQREASLATDNSSAREASVALNAGWDALAGATLSPAQNSALEGFYRDEFLPKLEKQTGERYADRAFVPDSAAGAYLQYWYTRQNGGSPASLTLTDPGDGSAYSAAHAAAQGYFANLVETVGYQDVLVMDLDANVVFSAYNTPALGTNLDDGPFRDSKLADGFRSAMTTNSIDTVVTTDMETWAPSAGAATMWVVSPIGDAGGITGAMALQVPVSWINDVTTGYGQWQAQGLGDTGEIYLAGTDGLMRSNSRQLIEDPGTYAQSVIDNGTTAADADRIVAVGDSAILQNVDQEPVRRALAGQSGTMTSSQYIGSESITAYGPANIEGLDWVVVARMETSEAFAPITDFTRTLLLSTLGLVLAISVLSLLLSQAFTGPIRRLAVAVRRIAGGDYSVRVAAGGSDEMGELSRDFNEMAAGLQIKQDLIDRQRAENDRLLRTLMPDSLAARYREGEQTIAEQHEDVAVVYAELLGFDDFSRALDGQQETLALNELMRGFDEAAERAGVESVRTLRGGYLASCGLTVPRVDNARRAVDFALGMRAHVQRFNERTGAALDLRAGVDTGAVTSGLVARASLAYDLWGDAVDLASRVRRAADAGGVYVSDAVHDRVHGLWEFTEVGTVDASGHTSTVWRIDA